MFPVSKRRRPGSRKPDLVAAPDRRKGSSSASLSSGLRSSSEPSGLRSSSERNRFWRLSEKPRRTCPVAPRVSPGRADTGPCPGPAASDAGTYRRSSYRVSDIRGGTRTLLPALVIAAPDNPSRPVPTGFPRQPTILTHQPIGFPRRPIGFPRQPVSRRCAVRLEPAARRLTRLDVIPPSQPTGTAGTPCLSSKHVPGTPHRKPHP